MTRKPSSGMSSSVPLTILVHEWVTGGGLAGQEVPPSWASEGRAIRRALALDFARLPSPGARVFVTIDARWPDDPAPWSILQINADDPPDRLYGLARQADYTVLIAPETRGVLARLARGLHDAGARSLGCSPEAIELTADKTRLTDWLLARGIVTPSYRRIRKGQGLPFDFPYPAVIKPIDGAGALDTFYVSDHRTLPDSARLLEEAILQPFCPGLPLSGTFLVSEDQEPLLLGVRFADDRLLARATGISRRTDSRRLSRG